MNVDLNKAIRSALKLKSITITKFDREYYGDNQAIYQVLKRNSATLHTICSIADLLEMKASELIALGEDK
jgi:hypothetical protein